MLHCNIARQQEQKYRLTESVFITKYSIKMLNIALSIESGKYFKGDVTSLFSFIIY